MKHKPINTVPKTLYTPCILPIYEPVRTADDQKHEANTYLNPNTGATGYNLTDSIV